MPRRWSERRHGRHQLDATGSQYGTDGNRQPAEETEKEKKREDASELKTLR
jgi:hypothetical protein